MMKKYLVVAVVLATVCLSTAAFAADVTVNGFVGIRSRLFENFDLDRSAAATDTASRTTTETAYRVDVNVKADNAKAKLSVWNDYNQWGRASGRTDTVTNMGMGGGITNGTTDATVGPGSTVFIREAWIDVMIPGTPVGIKAGRMNYMIGNGWFFRSNYGGVDQWIAYANIGPVTVSVLDAKVAEMVTGTTGAGTGNLTVNGTGTASVDTNTNDIDLYTAMVSAKLGNAGTAALAVSLLKDNVGVVLATPTYGAIGNGRSGRLWNIGLHANVNAGPANIKAEVDYQEGGVDTALNPTGYRGYQVVLQPSVKAGIVTINMLAASGSGNTLGKTAREQIVNFTDIGQHYTLIYEYRVKGASGATAGMFQNTTVLSVGALAQVLPNLGIGADVYFLRATERVALNGGDTNYDLGTEIDGKINWQITKDVSWNWQVGYFMPGGAYNFTNGKADTAWGAQGILGMAF